MREQTASEINLNRYERMKADLQFDWLAGSRSAQEEAIATHYTTYAHIALQLRQLIEERKMGGLWDCESLNETIQYMTAKIKEGHLLNFGIQLEWPKTP